MGHQHDWLVGGLGIPERRLHLGGGASQYSFQIWRRLTAGANQPSLFLDHHQRKHARGVTQQPELRLERGPREDLLTLISNEPLRKVARSTHHNLVVRTLASRINIPLIRRQTQNSFPSPHAQQMAQRRHLPLLFPGKRVCTDIHRNPIGSAGNYGRDVELGRHERAKRRQRVGFRQKIRKGYGFQVESEVESRSR